MKKTGVGKEFRKKEKWKELKKWKSQRRKGEKVLNIKGKLCKKEEKLR